MSIGNTTHEGVDDKVYFFKKVNHAGMSRSKDVYCYFTKVKLGSNYWIIVDTENQMEPIYASFEAMENFGSKVIAERIHDGFTAYLEELKRLKRSHFWRKI